MRQADVRFLEFGDFRFDLNERRLTRDGQRVRLRPKAADVLFELLKRHGDLVTKEEFRQSVWRGAFVDEQVLRFQVGEVRKALGEKAGEEQYIETVPGRGYRFVAEIREVPNQRSTATAPIAQIEARSEEFPQRTAPVAANGETVAIAGPGVRLRTLLSRRQFGWMTLLAVLFSLGLWLTRMPLRQDGTLTPVGAVRYTQLSHDNQWKDMEGPLFQVGARIYFNRGHERKLSWIPAEGGETTETAQNLSGFIVLDVSAARSEYLAKRPMGHDAAGELWSAPMLAGTPQRVGNIVCEFAAWSPDGHRIVYTTASELFVADRQGLNNRKLATLPAHPAWPKWSPDGTLIRFTVETAADRLVMQSLWEVEADGSGLREMLKGWNDPPQECCGIWTADGESFIFQSRRGWKVDLWVMPEGRSRWAQGHRPTITQLTNAPLSFFTPAASAVPERLLAIGVHDRGELVRYDFAVNEFVRYLGGLSATWVGSSRDGRQIGYVSYPEGALWVAKADGTGARQLTFPPLQVNGWSSSPDGRLIALRARLPRHRGKIYLMPAEGGEPHPISADDVEQGLPTWSPDGRRIVFGDVPEVFGQPQGSEVIRVYDVERKEFAALPDSHGLWKARWSPDGRYISALTIVGQRITLFEIATNRWRPFAADRVNNPTWSRDSRYIYYDTEGRTRALRRVRISDGVVEELVNLETFPRTTYWWSGLSLDDSPIVLRNIGAPEVYALDMGSR